MKPRLTANVLNGLATLAGLVEAGSSADILGADDDAMTPEQKRDWQDVLRASKWVWAMRRHRVGSSPTPEQEASRG